MDAVEIKPASTVPIQAQRSAKLLVLTLFVFGGVLLGIHFNRPTPIPSYAGRSAEDWLRDVYGSQTLHSTNPWGSMEPAIDAFRNMGTNGVQFLTEALGRQNTAWNRAALAIHPKLPIIVRRHVSEPVSADFVSGAASIALTSISDPRPEETLSQLIPLLDSPSSHTRQVTLHTVKRYVQNYPTLKIDRYETHIRKALNDDDIMIRLNAALVLTRANLAGSEVIPAIMPMLTNGNIAISNTVQIMIRQLEGLPPREQ